jgi:hypothetical protein
MVVDTVKWYQFVCAKQHINQSISVPTSIRKIPATAKSTPNAQIHNHIHFPGLSQAHQSKVAGLYCYLVL